jgi:5-methylcytosine-specific restriction endonuclease McrBC regulatory subunit McrC
VTVGDAKWKRLTARLPGFGLRAADTYQIVTYMTRHGLGSGLLFFPRQSWMGPAWREDYRLIGGDSRLKVVGVDVAGLVSRDHPRRRSALDDLRDAIVAAVESP